MLWFIKTPEGTQWKSMKYSPMLKRVSYFAVIQNWNKFMIAIYHFEIPLIAVAHEFIIPKRSTDLTITNESSSKGSWIAAPGERYPGDEREAGMGTGKELSSEKYCMCVEWRRPRDTGECYQQGKRQKLARVDDSGKCSPPGINTRSPGLQLKDYLLPRL